MSGSYLSKIERVCAPQNRQFGADLFLNKRNGTFFADVGGERVSEQTKAAAVVRIKELLAKVTQTEWRQVILLRVSESEDQDYRSSTENGKSVFSASCQFTYLRRERAANPLKPKELIEREHTDEFEERVKTARECAGHFERIGAHMRVRADEAEKLLRDQRAALANVDGPWTSFRDKVEEYELPYTPEAWAGIQRISQAIRETQAKLDAFARGATPEKLAQLAVGDVFKQLSAAPKPEQKARKR